MEHRRIEIVLLFALFAVVAACASVTPQTKSSSPSESKIIEEDVTMDRSGQPSGGYGQQPGLSGQPAPPVEEAPIVDPGARQPRRYHWRDRKGGGRNWSSEDAGEAEP